MYRHQKECRLCDCTSRRQNVQNCSLVWISALKQEKWLTQESQEVVWMHPESEGDKGILKYSVMEAEKPVDAELMQV